MKNRPDGTLVERLLLGPGPSNVSARVRQALARPLVGHLDPQFVQIMEETQELLRQIFQTKNSLTLPVSGTGSAGMEAAVANVVEEGDSVLVGINGVFGQRIAEMVERNGGRCTAVRAPFGKPLDEGELLAAAEKCKPQVIAVVHAETSTGVLQPLEPISSICRKFDALFLVDMVTSLGGHPVRVDDWGIDVGYSGTQKCLSCPPGLAPVTFSPRAEARIEARRGKCKSWYLDLSLVRSYWEERVYHHTAPISMNYALHESLRIVVEEGLEKRWARHQRNHLALVAGVEAMGLEMLVDSDYRLWSLNTIQIPKGVDDGKVRAQLLEEFSLEVGAGLGDLSGKVWRVGLMGENSRTQNVFQFLYALETCLVGQGFECLPGAGVQAAAQYYRSS